MRSLAIAFVTETFPPEINGVAMTVGQLVGGLRERGHRVEVIRPRQGGGDSAGPGETMFAGMAIPGYPGLRLGLPAGRSLTRLWRRQRPDLVHVVTEGPLGWSAVNAARRLGIPVTSGFHTNFDSYSVHYGMGWLRPLLAAYLRTLHRRTRITMVPTAALAADLAGEGLNGVRVVGRGVDTQLFHPQRRCRDLRTDWQIGATGPACLYVGRLAAEKNLALVSRCFSAIKAEHPEARMIWVGDGPSASQLRRQHGDHHFAGVRRGEDLAAHYASADVFLFPSLTETYGNVVAEAMASGVPVVAYRSAAAAELVRHGENGMLATPGDEAGYVSSVLWGLAEPGRLEKLARTARQSMLAHGWADVVASFEKVAREAIAA